MTIQALLPAIPDDGLFPQTMTRPFVCRQCLVRLAQFRVRRSKTETSHLHTQAAPSSPAPPMWDIAGELRQEKAVQVWEESTDDHRNHVPKPLHSTANAKPTIKWQGKLKKYVPENRPDVGRLLREPPAESQYILKSKIMRALGSHWVVSKDLMYMYGLSYEEARHAVSQLKKLLWGRSAFEGGQRLDLYLFWKDRFKNLLPNNSPSVAQGGAASPQVGPWSSLDRKDLDTIQAAWHRVAQERREFLWPQMILSAFRSNPGIVPGFIQVTFESSWCPSYVVEDSVYLLFRALDALQASHDSHMEVAELVVFLLKTCPPRYLSLEQMVIQKVLSLIPTSSASGLYQTLKKVEHPLQMSTLLHFASRFAREAKYKQLAAEIIYFLSSKPQFDINSPAAASVCTTLLTVEKNGALPQGHTDPDVLLKLLLDAGFRPNLLSLSALMRNFCIRGHLDTAWKIFEVLTQHNITPDPYVFSILLDGSKHNMDIESLERVIDLIEPSGEWTPVLLNDLLDFLYEETEYEGDRRRRQLQTTRARTFRAMIKLYAKFFVLAPLQRLFAFPLEHLVVSESISPYKAARAVAPLRPRPEVQLMQPDSITLGLMLRAHIRSIRTTENLSRAYNYFLGLLHTRDRVVLKVIKDQGTVFHDAFLHCFLQFSPTFDHAIQMVENMIVDHEREQQELGLNELHPAPSIYTYTILMNGFRKHGNPRGVISTLNMMVNDAGINPNLVAWNTVIATLLGSGYIVDAVSVTQHMKQAGFQWNAHTIQAFNGLSRMERVRVSEMLEKARGKPEDLSDQALVTRLLQNMWARSLRRNISYKYQRIPGDGTGNRDRSQLTINTGSADPR
ncbi:hypothetical protein GGS23DRAFT_590180 [Durotheca rogersii]|uniref:uncharacterized protein n=1 Tax=Durotheca rogersii TaxID=419775 RepID=UPI00221E9321|nr:uncharacterized protein GGS23DRAFT_590180 [Durotheca rogersii]KAI5855049.1 hypothetical protein GGS23DRAFT_590180 [Durotheca rogersii]